MDFLTGEGSNSLAVLPNVEVKPLADLFTKTWYSKACTHVLNMHFETLFKAMNSMVVWHLKHKSSFEAVFFERPVQRTCTMTIRTLHQPTLWASKDEERRWVESLLQVWLWWLGECAERQMPKELKVLLVPFLPSWKCGICLSFFSNVTMALVANVGVWSFPAPRGIVTWTNWVDLPRPTRFCGVCYQVYWPTLRWFG